MGDTDRLARWVDLLLDNLESSEAAPAAKGESLSIKLTTRDLDYFSPAEPIMGPIESLASDYDRWFFTDVSPADIGQWDLSILNLPQSEEDKEEVRYTLTRARRIPLKELRGIPIRSQWVAGLTSGFVKKDGTFFAVEMMYNYIGGKWVHLMPHRFRNRGRCCDGGFALSAKPLPQVFESKEWDEGPTNLQVALGIAFTRDYEWTVQIGRPGSLSLLFVTDPIGARAFFKLREAPPEESRRKALKNWVCQHWRKSRTDADVKVRQHLRGSESFVWRGYNCILTPSAYDLRKNEQLRIERDAERQKLRNWAVSRFGERARRWA